MSELLPRDIPRVLTVENRLPTEAISLAGVTTVPRGGRVTVELFKISEARRQLVYSAIQNCVKGGLLSLVQAELPSHLSSAPPVPVSSPTPSGVTAAPTALQVPQPVAGAPAETASAPVADVPPAPPVVPPAPPAPPAPEAEEPADAPVLPPIAPPAPPAAPIPADLVPPTPPVAPGVAGL